mgnify:CR=1 FL=1
MIAERDQRLGEVEGGGIVQAHQLAEVRKPDAFAVTRDFLENRKRAPERLHAAALRSSASSSMLGSLDGTSLRDRRPCAEWPACRSSSAWCAVSRNQLSTMDEANSIRPSSPVNRAMASLLA